MQRFDLVGSGIVSTATARVHADSRISVFLHFVRGDASTRWDGIIVSVALGVCHSGYGWNSQRTVCGSASRQISFRKTQTVGGGTGHVSDVVVGTRGPGLVGVHLS